MTTSSPRETPESLREVASEIIRLYHSPAPIRENLDLIQRHGLAMARALVEIDKALYAARQGVTQGRWDMVDEEHCCIAGLLDGSIEQ